MTTSDTDHFHDKWANLIQSLDVGPDKAKGIEQLPPDQKLHLLEKYATKNPKCSAYHYVSLIKGLRVGRSALANSVRKGENQQPKNVLLATEISLRTNDVGWVYDFLDQNGLNTLVNYVSKAVHVLITADFRAMWGCSSHQDLANRLSTLSTNAASSSDDLHYDSQDDAMSKFALWCTPTKKKRALCKRRILAAQPSNVSDSIRDSLHQAVKCFRALLNNQRGCSLTLEHPHAINVITLCLVHPSFATKTLVLELLAAVCLIVGGHDHVLTAFDNFKKEVGEYTRFEYLVDCFFTHDTCSADDYNMDFMVSCMQFFNIVVHSTDDIRLRVFLQEEFRHLGLNTYLDRAHHRAGERLLRQIKAYNDNEVNVAMLVEDSQAREICQQEKEQLESDMIVLQSRMATLQTESQAQIMDLQNKIQSLEVRNTELKELNQNQTGQLTILRTRLQNTDQSSSDRERQLEDRIRELEQTLAKSSVVSHSESNENVKTAVVPPPPPLPPPLLPASSKVPLAPPLLMSANKIPAPPGLPVNAKQNGVECVSIRPPVQTRFKLPLVNWTTLRDQQLRGTIFVGMNDEAVLEHLDTERLENLFKLSNQSVSGPVTNGVDLKDSQTCKRLEKKKSLIDSNRHRCIGVLSRYLESEKYSSERLWNDINHLELSQDVADRIYHQLPTSDEMKMYLNYEFTEQRPIDELTEEDRLLLHLCKIERLGPRLEIILFMNSFEDTINSLTSKISAVRSASFNLKKSEKFRAILELVLAFGNYMNSSRRGIIYGFRLQSLNALSDTRTLDKTWTLLHFLVETIELKFPALLTFYEELGNYIGASKVPMEALTAEVNALVSGMTQADNEMLIAGPLKTPSRLSDFIASNKSKVETIERDAEMARNVFSQTLEWFGEAQNKPSPEQFFGMISRFIEQFKKALVDNERRRRADALLMLRSATEGDNLPSGVNSNQNNALSRKPKDELPLIELQKRLAQEAKLSKRRFVNRTRQITGDGMMDEILAVLVSKPLQAEVHPRRSRMSEDNY